MQPGRNESVSEIWHIRKDTPKLGSIMCSRFKGFIRRGQGSYGDEAGLFVHFAVTGLWWKPQIELPPLISWKIQETCTEKKGWCGEMVNEEGKYGYR